MAKKKRGELVCCTMCGRDTTAADSVCSRCRSSFFDHKEEIGRKSLPPSRANSPFDECYEENEYEPNSHEEYHGGSIRDDI